MSTAPTPPPPPAPERTGWRALTTPANIVTLTRILLIPVFVFVILAPWPAWMPDPPLAALIKPWVAALVFGLLAATDGVDGYLARSRNEVTTVGQFLDPLADKILVAAALLALVELTVLPTWIALVIIGREFLVSGLRMIAAAEGKVISASSLGKLKTVLQIAAIILFIIKDSMLLALANPAGFSLLTIVDILAWIVMAAALLMTLVSMLDYLRRFSAVIGLSADRPSPPKKPTTPEAAQPATDQSEPAQGKKTQVNGAIAFSVGGEDTGGRGSCEVADAAPEAAAAAAADAGLSELAATVLQLARDRNARLGTAESCTGGLVAAALTEVPGSSDVFFGAVVSYDNSVKAAALGVPAQVLESVGAVSEECALAMAEGACRCLGVDLAVSTSGIAGPGGGSPQKPVGLVCFAVAGLGRHTATTSHFTGDRAAIRQQACQYALELLQQALESRN